MAAPIFRRSLTPVLGAVALLLFGATFVQQAHRLTSRAERCDLSVATATAHAAGHHAIVVERTVRHAEARLRDLARHRHDAAVRAHRAVDVQRAEVLRERAQLALERARLMREAERIAQEAERLGIEIDILAEDEG